MIETRQGTAIAKNFTRVVYGRRGDYVEIAPDQFLINNARKVMDNTVIVNGFYDEYRTVPDDVKVYYQHHFVGYADYKPGFFYISVDNLKINIPHRQRKLFEFV